MINLSTHPSISRLHELIDQVPSYPISAGQLVQLAKRRRFPSEVIDFYRPFRSDQLFYSRDHLEAQTEVVELMQTEPQAYEDVVHGAED